MLYRRRVTVLSLLLLIALLVGVYRPVVAEPAAQQGDKAALAVMEQFWEAWNTADKDMMMSLLTDDVAWVWLDSAKNFPVFLPEGKYSGQGKAEVGAMFDNNPVQWGYSGYPVWVEVQGNKIVATEVWQSGLEREIDVPLIAKSTYTIRKGKLAEWVWDVSPESSNRITFTPNTLEANRQLMTSINEEIWNQGNLDLIDERYAEDYVRHEAGYPAELAGAAGLKLFIENLRTGFPDWNCTIEDMLAADDKVMVRYLCSGTHTGEWNGLAPTGKPIQFQSIIVHRIADGQVVEDWSEYDSLGWMQQLGFVLGPPDAAAPGKVLMSQLAEAWSSDAPELIDATLAPDFVLHCAECPDIADIPQYKEWVAFVRDFAPDFRTTFTDLIAEGEWVVARGTSDATIVELGDPIHPIYGQLQIARVVDGQIAELWLVSDEVAVNKIFGEIPNPEQRVEFLWGDDSTLQGATGTRAENTELVRQWVEGDDSARESLAADEFMFHSTLYPEQHTYQDRTQIMDELRTAFPDLSITLEEPLIAEGEKVAVRFTLKGTHTGPYFDLEASGKALEWPGIAVYRVLDGKIAEEWMLWSGYYVYSQIRGW